MFPSLILKNQFGEQSENTIIGGSSKLWCNFVVDQANGNGLGLRTLKSSGPASNPDIVAAFMHTSTTPLAGNPNPEVGGLMIKFGKAYAGYQDGTYGFVSPVSGTPIAVTTGVTAGLLYVIVTLGSTSLAGWQHLGLPVGTVPAVGVAFIATSTTTTTGTGYIEVPSVSALMSMEVVGDPNQSVSAVGGGYMISQFLAPTISTGAYIAPVIPTAPADGTVVGLTFNLVPNAGSLI